MVISRTTNVIISAITTVPMSQVVQALPGSTTEVSGKPSVVSPGSTTIPANSRLSGLSGIATVISSLAFVIVSSPETLRLGLRRVQRLEDPVLCLFRSLQELLEKIESGW
jgi:hypothetical protein